MSEDSDAIDHWLLDLLCACADNGCAVTDVREALNHSLARLRDAGLVAPHKLMPSPTAQIEWYNRRARRTALEFIAPPAEPELEPELEPEPPTPPKAKRKPVKSIIERGKVWEAKHKSAGVATPPAGPSGSCLPTAKSAAARSLPDEAPPALVPSQLRPWSPPVPTSAPVVMSPEDARLFRQSSERRKRLMIDAEKRVDAGQKPGFAPMGAVRTMMKAVVEQREHAARALDPVERAKLYLQRRRIVVFSAHIKGGPKGKYYVGNTIMSEAEMVDYSERMQARTRAA